MRATSAKCVLFKTLMGGWVTCEHLLAILGTQGVKSQKKGLEDTL